MTLIPSLSIVVPAYNEEANVARTILATEAVLRDQVAERLEWIMIDDGSTDGTWPEITRLARSIPETILVRHMANKGLGVAIWTGMARASSAWCTWLPADGQIAPQAIADMARLADRADLIMLMRNENEREQGRRILTLAFYGLMRLVLEFDPYGFSGVFMARQQAAQAVRLRSTTGLQNYVVVMHCQKKGLRIEQTCTVIQPRLSGKSKVANLRTMVKTLYGIVGLRLIA
jgi:glycosyltransferase involved in cell wall biosynthesis